MKSMSFPDYCSSAMRRVQVMARRVAESDSPVLLLGESGSGKNHLARYIHDQSRRSGGPFFGINCAALPGELVESELFGHEAGSFTGARSATAGLIDAANGGTLHFEEIGETLLLHQGKLLTFLDSGEILRVGGRKKLKVNVRVIASTNRDLKRMVSQGTFRLDLFYRLNVFPIILPPLRARKEEIPLLSDQLLTTLATEMGLERVPSVDPVVLERLVAYEWPGNVRELRNVLERALILADGPKIGPRDIHFDNPPTRQGGGPFSSGISDSEGTEGTRTTVAVPDSARHVLEVKRIHLSDEELAGMIGELFGGEPTPVGVLAQVLGYHRRTLSARINNLGLTAGRPGRIRTGEKQAIDAAVRAWLRDNAEC